MLETKRLSTVYGLGLLQCNLEFVDERIVEGGSAKRGDTIFTKVPSYFVMEKEWLLSDDLNHEFAILNK